MNLYEKLPTDFLIDFYNEINKNIQKGLLTETMYYELRLITSILEKRKSGLSEPADVKKVVEMKNYKNKSA